MTFQYESAVIERGTLTLLADGGVVVGMPRDIEYEALDGVLALIKEWLKDTTQILMVAFPIDVDDQRPAPRQEVRAVA